MISERLSTEQIVASLNRLQAKRKEPSTIQNDNQLKPYFLAAAVLHVFDPRTLRPYGPTKSVDNPFVSLLDYSVPAVGWRFARFRSLKQDVRKRTLLELGSRNEVKGALSANPERERTSLQALFEKWADGEKIALERLTYSELENLRQLYAWGLDSLGGLPERERFEAVRMRRSTVAVFEHLVDERFVGRVAELQVLRDHVGVVSPSLWSQIRSFLRPGARPPLVLWGPGGVGKTALIGRFLMEHVEAPETGWFPFAYLPFDSETLDVREPFTLLVEASAQLSRHVSQPYNSPEARTSLTEAFSKFQSSVELYRDQRGRLRQRASASPSQQARLRELSTVENGLYNSFARLLEEVGLAAGTQQRATKTPVLIVLDSFEEVLYRTNEDLLGLWNMLSAVQADFPDLRVVIAGRSRPRPFTVGGKAPAEHELGDLGETDAIELLEKLGVETDAAARAIVRQIGGNPLTLRLAARNAEEEPADVRGIIGIETKRYWILNIAPELIRGQLYRRILDHIHDHDVRALAHPGMILRRVTSQIIEEVLAPVCDLKEVDSERAEELFNALRREHALVRLDDDSSLRYREEVRRPMLELLNRDRPIQVNQIHNSIIDYYRQHSSGAHERAEEIYHCLMIGRDVEELDERWIQGVERYLSSAIEEIPPIQRIWLASRMSIELPKEIAALADTAVWERLCGRKAVEALRHEGPRRVLQLVGERKDRTLESPLFAVEARALMALDRPAEAASLIDRAVSDYPAFGNPGRLAELLWLRSQAALKLGQTAGADQFLKKLEEVATSLTTQLPLVQALTERVSLSDDLKHAGSAILRERLAAALSQLSEDQIDSERALIRLALVRLGPNFPALVRRLVPLVAESFSFSYRIEENLAAPAIRRIAEMLQPLDVMGIGVNAAKLAQNYQPSMLDGFFSELLVAMQAEPPDLRFVSAVLCLMGVENATLASATLAGLDDYREPSELDVTASEATA